MTVIAAIAVDDHVVMACDTAVDYSGTAIYRAHGKISTLRTPKGEKVLLAASGAADMLPLIMRNLKVADAPDAADPAAADAWADAVAEAITGITADANPPLLTTADSGTSAAINGTLILAWRQHLWWIYTHTADRVHPAVLAIGSGCEVALGSLHTSVALGAKAVDAVDMAVRLACRHASGCGVDDRGPMLHTTAAD
jgi:ATP-dependent protease HslVU (ClpYQ) peptidase subunit